MILPVFQYPHPILKQVSSSVTDEDLASEEWPKLLQALKDTCFAAQGAAISAVQVGVLKRVIVIHPDISEGNEVLINPLLLSSSTDITEVVEGCLSLVGIRALVSRPGSCTVRATDENGATITVYGSGNLAQALLHELEHLDGMLLLDKVKPVKREMIKRRMHGRKGNAFMYGNQ